jgi:elongation factor P
MDSKTYEQVNLTEDQAGASAKYLTDNLEVEILMWQERPLDISLPNFVTLRVTHTTPGVRGDTATNVTKEVTVETGYTLQGPGFLEEGELISVDTRTGDYATRVKA